MKSLIKILRKPFIYMRVRLYMRHLEDEIKIINFLDDNEEGWINFIRADVGLRRGRMYGALARLRMAKWLSVDWGGPPPAKYQRKLSKLIVRETKR